MKKVIALSALLLSGLAQAEGFVGAGIGQSKFGALGNDTSYWVGGGYRFNDYVGVEAKIIDFGNVEGSNYFYSYEIGGRATNLGVIAYLPFGDNHRFALHAKAGADIFSNDNGNRNDDDETDFYWGAGLSARVSDNAQFQIDFERHNPLNLEIDVISLGLFYTFGR